MTVAVTMLAGAGKAAAVPLEYTLSAPLKQPNCAEDGADSDCLSDALERDLAWVLAPHHFFDEGEECPARFMYYQVRPDGAASSTQDVSAWTPGGGTYRVNVTYFINFTTDCNGGINQGHTGDNEHVRFVLKSTNLTTWTVEKGIYPAHGGTATFNRDYLVARANEIGSSYPSVASDEDGHGSFPGASGSNEDCGGPLDGYLRDCFSGGSMRAAYQNNYWTWLVSGAELDRNIGEPWGYWNRTIMEGTGVNAWSRHWNGSINSSEFWSDTTGTSYAAFRSFCGWQCSARRGAGSNWTCIGGAGQDLGSCTSPMWDKVDRVCFRVNWYNFFWSGC